MSRNWAGRFGRDEFLSRVELVPFSTCWYWMGSQGSYGKVAYGSLSVDGKTKMAHRLAYELFIGPIPSGLVIDHLCRQGLCVNPEHLEVVTAKENTLRGFGPTAMNARATHCPLGHPYEEPHVYRMKNGKRRCGVCKKRNQKSWKDRAKIGRTEEGEWTNG